MLPPLKAILSKHSNLSVNPFVVTVQGRTSGAARDRHMKNERVELRLSWPFPFLLLLSLCSIRSAPPPFPPFPFLCSSPCWISPILPPLLLQTSISRAQCTSRSRKTSPPPPPPKCQWSMESSLCLGKQQYITATHLYILNTPVNVSRCPILNECI